MQTVVPSSTEAAAISDLLQALSFDRPAVARTDAEARQVALAAGETHAKGLKAFWALSDFHGGGVIGGALGLLAEYHRQDVISSSDLLRLQGLFEAFRTGDRQAAMRRSVEIHNDALADPNATPLALGLTSIAASNAALSAIDSRASTTAAADIAGYVLGFGIGGVGSVVLSLTASLTADSM